MDLLLDELRAAYRESPRSILAFLAGCAALGVAFGYLSLGPAIFG